MWIFTKTITRPSRRARRVLGALLLGVVTLAISACDVLIEFVPPEPDLAVTAASYGTNFQDRDNNSIICDNYTTKLTYRFEYSGDLDRWDSHIRGVRSGEIRGDNSFTFSDGRIDNFGDDYVRVTYDIPPAKAPLSVADGSESGIDPESIVVVPNPTILGYSRLILTVYGGGERYAYESAAIPVVSSCRL